MTCVFLTGGTGVVGSALAERLLRESGVELRLLVRAASPGALNEKRELLRRYWAEGGIPEVAMNERVRFVLGDVGVEGLGLARRERAALAARCTHVVHCAGEVRMNLPLEAARRSAGVALDGVLALAREIADRGRLAKLDVVSTVGVGGRRPGVLPERWIDTPRAFHNTYEQAKAEAEDRLRADGAMLPFTVHRPSMVVGEATSGRVMRYQVFYHLAEFFSGTRTAGFFPPLGRAVLDLVPVDFVANAIAWSVLHPEASRGRILHLSAGEGGALALPVIRERTRAAFERAGRRTPRPIPLPASVFRAALALAARFVGDGERRALGTLPVFLDYLASDQRFGNVETLRTLREAGIRLPTMAPVLDVLLDRWLRDRAVR